MFDNSIQIRFAFRITETNSTDRLTSEFSEGLRCIHHISSKCHSQIYNNIFRKSVNSLFALETIKQPWMQFQGILLGAGCIIVAFNIIFVSFSRCNRKPLEEKKRRSQETNTCYVFRRIWPTATVCYFYVTRKLKRLSSLFQECA